MVDATASEGGDVLQSLPEPSKKNSPIGDMPPLLGTPAVAGSTSAGIAGGASGGAAAVVADSVPSGEKVKVTLEPLNVSPGAVGEGP